MAEVIYRLIEHIDGEKGGRAFVPYAIAQAVKAFLLMYFIK